MYGPSVRTVITYGNLMACGIFSKQELIRIYNISTLLFINIHILSAFHTKTHLNRKFPEEKKISKWKKRKMKSEKVMCDENEKLQLFGCRVFGKKNLFRQNLDTRNVSIALVLFLKCSKTLHSIMRTNGQTHKNSTKMNFQM